MHKAPLPGQRDSVATPQLTPLPGCQPASHTTLPVQMKMRMILCHSKQMQPPDTTDKTNTKGLSSETYALPGWVSDIQFLAMRWAMPRVCLK